MKFDLQTIHHDDLLRRLYERETDLAVAFAVPPGSALGHLRLGAGELVVLYREADMPNAPTRVDIGALEGRPLVSLAASGPIGQCSPPRSRRAGSRSTKWSRRAPSTSQLRWCGWGGLTVVDNFTALASLGPGLAMRPLANPLRFDVNAMYLHDRAADALSTAFEGARAEDRGDFGGLGA